MSPPGALITNPWKELPLQTALSAKRKKKKKKSDDVFTATNEVCVTFDTQEKSMYVITFL